MPRPLCRLRWSAAPILDAAVEQGKLKVVGGIYRLTTGTVDLVAQG
nr:hypothetical protein [Bradyrhizobium centrolobii]